MAADDPAEKGKAAFGWRRGSTVYQEPAPRREWANRQGRACFAAEGAVSSGTMKPLNDRDTFLVLAVVAVAAAGL
ncbi:MAG TPA: hypothetical protein P5137_12535, partial [Candidatus Brocadiia bacterium]|nr:hypothetical protein [Candidatus Brocadiia bacterium]